MRGWPFLLLFIAATPFAGCGEELERTGDPIPDGGSTAVSESAAPPPPNAPFCNDAGTNAIFCADFSTTSPEQGWTSTNVQKDSSAVTGENGAARSTTAATDGLAFLVFDTADTASSVSAAELAFDFKIEPGTRTGFTGLASLYTSDGYELRVGFSNNGQTAASSAVLVANGQAQQPPLDVTTLPHGQWLHAVLRVLKKTDDAGTGSIEVDLSNTPKMRQVSAFSAAPFFPRIQIGVISAGTVSPAPVTVLYDNVVLRKLR